MADSSRACGLLVVVLDTNPIWWGQQLLKVNREVSALADNIIRRCCLRQTVHTHRASVH